MSKITGHNHVKSLAGLSITNWLRPTDVNLLLPPLSETVCDPGASPRISPNANILGFGGTASFLRPRCNFIHPRQLSPLPERLELPFSSDEILSCYEDIVSLGSDHYTACVKVSPHEVLVQHMVDIQKSYRRFSRGFRKEACYIFSNKQCRQTFCYPINCADATQHLQLEPWATTRKGRCLRKTDCRQVACHYLAGSIRVCRSWHSHRSVPRDPLCRLRDSLQ